MHVHYLDDYRVGDRFESPEVVVTRDDIFAFARDWDPQPFHLDEDAARRSPFGELVGSGWHTAALTMRLLVASELRPAGGIIGFGVDELRWPNPLRPGDRMKLRIEVLEIRRSEKSPDRGVMRVKVEGVNQDGRVVISFMPIMRVPRRNSD